MRYERPTREGYRLKYDYECDYNNWLDLGGCTCPFSSPPCSSCTHEGHPISLEENDEAWELDIEEEDMSRGDIIKKSPTNLFKEGDRVEVLNQYQLNHMSEYSALTLGKSYQIRTVCHTGNIKIVDDKGSLVTWDSNKFKKVDKPVEFKVGDRVVLRESSEYYNCLRSNQLPKGVEGQITEIHLGSHPYEVKWGNGSNGYRDKDLQLAEDHPTFSVSSRDDNIDSISFCDIGLTKGRDSSTNKPSGRSDAIVDAYSTAILKDYCKKDVELTTKLNKQEEIDMTQVTNRKTVTVNLIDRDGALDEKYSVVASFGQFTTSKTPEALIRSIIMDTKNKVAELIAQHNEIRTKQTNTETLNRTGNKVTLEPVEESDLYWEIQ